MEYSEQYGECIAVSTHGNAALYRMSATKFTVIDRGYTFMVFVSESTARAEYDRLVQIEAEQHEANQQKLYSK
jgi:hypothetical protein